MQHNGEVQRRQITLNSVPATFVRPLPRSVSWLVAAKNLQTRAMAEIESPRMLFLAFLLVSRYYQ
jgi:hypothetical protein